MANWNNDTFYQLDAIHKLIDRVCDLGFLRWKLLFSIHNRKWKASFSKLRTGYNEWIWIKKNKCGKSEILSAVASKVMLHNRLNNAY